MIETTLEELKKQLKHSKKLLKKETDKKLQDTYKKTIVELEKQIEAAEKEAAEKEAAEKEAVTAGETIELEASTDPTIIQNYKELGFNVIIKG